MCACIDIYLYMCMYISMYICIHTHLYIYTHLHVYNISPAPESTYISSSRAYMHTSTSASASVQETQPNTYRDRDTG